MNKHRSMSINKWLFMWVRGPAGRRRASLTLSAGVRRGRFIGQAEVMNHLRGVCTALEPIPKPQCRCLR